jgi:hypothetical protein
VIREIALPLREIPTPSALNSGKGLVALGFTSVHPCAPVMDSGSPNWGEKGWAYRKWT